LTVELNSDNNERPNYITNPYCDKAVS